MRYLLLAVFLSGCASTRALSTETVSVMRTSTVAYRCDNTIPGRCDTGKFYYLESATGKQCRVSEKDYWLAKRDSVFTCRWQSLH